MTTRLPVLESLRIASPCNEDWDDMSGDERVRFCGKCEKNVYNLSAMSRAAAEELVRAKEGRLCVRFYQRSDGTILSGDCPVGERRLRLRQRVWARVSGLAASAMLLLGVAAGRARADLSVGEGKKPVAQKPVRVLMGAPPPQPPLMGKIALRPEPAPTVKMGEPRAIMGDVVAPAPRTK
jgi:hypothetical protein